MAFRVKQTAEADHDLDLILDSALAAEGGPPLQKHFFSSLLADTPVEFTFDESNGACR
jgi:hypothetical protein